MGPGCLPLALFLALLILLPLLFGQLFATALLKLRLTPEVALLAMAAIFLGSAINLPLKRIVRTEDVAVHPMAMFGLYRWWPHLERIQKETIIAVNVGGCLVPVALAAYEALYVAMAGWRTVGALGLAIAMNVAICYWIAKPVPGIGIAMPALVPPIVAVLAAMLLAPDERVPIAFVAGVLGPLIGADLLNLKEIPKISTGVASIGGAGTFDGIVLSGILAAYLA